MKLLCYTYSSTSWEMIQQSLNKSSPWTVSVIVPFWWAHNAFINLGYHSYCGCGVVQTKIPILRLRARCFALCATTVTSTCEGKLLLVHGVSRGFSLWPIWKNFFFLNYRIGWTKLRRNIYFFHCLVVSHRDASTARNCFFVLFFPAAGMFFTILFTTSFPSLTHQHKRTFCPNFHSLPPEAEALCIKSTFFLLRTKLNSIITHHPRRGGEVEIPECFTIFTSPAGCTKCTNKPTLTHNLCKGEQLWKLYPFFHPPTAARKGW